MSEIKKRTEEEFMQTINILKERRKKVKDERK
jgi:hypothetical protein